MKTPIFALLALALGVCGCSCGHTLRDLPPQGNERLASPMLLGADTTLLYATDYYPQLDAPDSITTSAPGVRLQPLEGQWDRFDIVLGAQAPKLFVLDVWTGGRKLAIVAQDRRTPQADTPLIYAAGVADDGSLIAKFTRRPERIVALWQNVVLPDELVEVHDDRIEVRIPTNARRVEHRFWFERQPSFVRLYAAADGALFDDVLVPLEQGVPVRDVARINHRDRQAQVIYSLLVDRFVDGNPANTRKLNRPDVLPQVDYMGGDIAGVTAKIMDGYFDSLGINTIWLSPIVRNPDDAWGQYPDPATKFSGYHGYWPLQNTVIDPRMGTPEELEALLSTAHACGINVILDYVSNHLHIDNPTFRAHPDWATPLELPDGRRNLELWDEHRLTTWFDLHIPSLDLERPEVYEPMSDSALFWMTRYDFDGFRHDATKHIPEVYWRTLTRKLVEQLPHRELYQIGETYGSSELIGSYVRSGMLDAQFDFNLYDAAIWNIIPPEGSMQNVANTLQQSLLAYGYHNLMGYITGNHDRPRFVSLAGGAVRLDEDAKLAGWKREIGVGDTIGYRRLALLEALMLTIPGVPTIYQGDEFGQSGANDPDNRRMMRFADLTEREQRQLELTRRLVHLRRTELPLIYGTYIPLHADVETMAYARVYMGEVIVVVLDKTFARTPLRPALPIATDGAWTTLLDEPGIAIYKLKIES